MIIVNVLYKMEPGKRDAFLREVSEAGIDVKSREEAGNIRYDYFFPIGNDTDVFLLENWKDQAAFDVHKNEPHFQELQKIKERYVTAADIKVMESK